MSADPAGFALINPNRKGHSVIEATNWYAYAGNNPVRFIDPTGEKISLHAHRVLRFKKYHWSIRITLDTPELKEAFEGDKRFDNVDDDGNRYATIGAGPNWLLKLVSNVNRDKDVELDNKEVSIPLDIGDNEEKDLILKLFDADDAYEVQTDYTILLKERKGDGFNSNSFFTGILRFLGIIPPSTDLDSPGYYNPVPPEEFTNDQPPTEGSCR